MIVSSYFLNILEKGGDDLNPKYKSRADFIYQLLYGNFSDGIRLTAQTLKEIEKLGINIDELFGPEPHYELRDKEGNIVLRDYKLTEAERQRIERKIIADDLDKELLWTPPQDLDEKARQLKEDLLELGKIEEIELEIDGDDGQLKEKKFQREPDDEPRWTEVRGSASFYCICPICGTMVPGTGPAIDCADGVGRRPKELHEWWHKTVHCDWYQD